MAFDPTKIAISLCWAERPCERKNKNQRLIELCGHSVKIIYIKNMF
jgi:hypothetical protein